MASLRSDGKAVDITLTAVTTKDTPVLEDGFHGIAMTDGSSGDIIAIEIAQREHEITVPSAVTAAKGDVLYLDATGTITNTDTDRAFMKVTLAKDSNNIVWGVLLAQESLV